MNAAVLDSKDSKDFVVADMAEQRLAGQFGEGDTLGQVRTGGWRLLFGHGISLRGAIIKPTLAPEVSSRQRGLHQAARLGKIHLSGKTLLQLRHGAPHVLERCGFEFLD